MNYDINGFYPSNYFRTGYFPLGATSSSSPVSGVQELDIRLYNSDGTRKYLPREWVSNVEFEIGERGGYLNGSLTFLTDWEQSSLDGTEFVDVFCFGERVYRGYALLRQKELGDAEKTTLTLYGLMERLSGYIVRRCYCYASPVDISQVFLDIANDYVRSTDRLPNLVLEASGVPSLGIALTEFCAKGRTVAQALNQLCDLAPQQLIWGCDVDDSGNDRLYLRPRTEEIAYRFSVGKEVSALLYPQDVTQVVNRVYVTGGAVDPPNLAPNSSFEACSAVDELSANLLLNPSFEDEGESRKVALHWERGYDACRRVFPDDSGVNLARTGNAWIELDNIWDGAPENVTQNEIHIGSPQPIKVSVWARQMTNGDTERLRIELFVWDSANVLLETLDSADLTPQSDQWERFEWEFLPYHANATKVSVRFMLVSAGGTGHGVLLDDASCWLSNPQLEDWRVGNNTNAYFTLLDWRNRETAFDGEIAIKTQVAITGGGGYAEICTREASALDIKPGKTYYLSLYVKGVEASPQVRIGARQYADSTYVGESLSDLMVASAFGWTRITMSLTTTTEANRLEPFIRIYNGDAVYLDGFMVTLGTQASTFYTGSVFQAARSVTDYDSTSLGTEVYESIATWGVREKEEQVEYVKDVATLDAFCKGYFKAHATPAIQARLTIQGAEAAVGLEGKVKILNLPSAPDPLFPVKVRYRFGESFDLDIDLNNARPDLAQLLKRLTTIPSTNTQNSGGGARSGGERSGVGSVFMTRRVDTTSPLSGGGALDSDLTLSLGTVPLNLLSPLTASRIPVTDGSGFLTSVSGIKYSGTNILIAGDGTGAPRMDIDGASGNSREVRWYTNGVRRWVFRADSTTESGSNAGTNFNLLYYSDAGNASTLFFGERSSGNTAFGTTTVLSGVRVNVSGGDVNVDTGKGYRINNTATSGNFLRGNGTRFVDAAIVNTDLPTNIAVNKLVAQTASRLIVSDGSGFLTTLAGLSYASGGQTLNVGDGTGAPTLFLNGANGSNRLLRWATNGLARFGWTLNTDAESTSNAGSNMEFRRWADDGSTLLGTVLAVRRSDGAIVFGGTSYVAGTLSLSGLDLNLASGQGIQINTTATSGNFLRGNGTRFVDAAIQAGDLPTGIAVNKLTAQTASKVVVTDGSGFITTATPTTTEINFVAGVTSAIQTQLNAKEASITAGTTSQYWRGDKSWQTLNSAAVGAVTDPGANGLMARTSGNTSVARTLSAGTGVTVSNGDGVSGNPIISIGQAVSTTSDVTFRWITGTRLYGGDSFSGLYPLNVELTTTSGNVLARIGGGSGSTSRQALICYDDGRVELANGTNGKIGFFGTTGQSKQTITGSRSGNVALANLLTALNLMGLVTDTTTV